MEKNHSRKRIFLTLILSLFAILSLSHSLFRWGFADEIGTIADGYSHLFFDFRMGQNNPPLSKQLMALPLLFLNLDFPVNEPAWKIGHDANGEYSHSFFFKNRVSHEKIILVSRMVSTLFACILGLLLFLWAKQLWDQPTAFCSLILYSLWPAILGYSSVAQTDMAITLAFFASIFALWKYLNCPNKKTFFILGLATGLAFATKLTSILLPPIQFFIHSLREKSFFNKRFFYLAAAWGIAIFVLILDYGIFGVPRFIDTFRWVLGNTLGVRESQVFFFGKSYAYHPLYYGAIVLLKNPIPILFFSIFGTILNWKKKDTLFLFIPILALFISASRSKIQLGERFILPLYPFLALLAGSAFSFCYRHSKKMVRFGSLALLLWLIFSDIVTYPYYLSYVNALGGGADKGWRYMGYLEQGQDVKRVFQFWQRFPQATLIGSFHMWEIIPWTTPYKMQLYFPENPSQEALSINRVDTQKEFLALGVSSFGENKKAKEWGGAEWFLKNRTPIQRLGTIWIYDVTWDPEAHLWMANRYENYSKREPTYALLATRELERVRIIKNSLNK